MSSLESASAPIKVLFICLGNICRSPLSEAVFIHLVKEQGLSDQITVDSAGTAGYHVGNRPDIRSIAICQQYGVKIESKCRQVSKADFTEFDYLIGMDEENMKNLRKIQPRGSKASLRLFGSFGDGKEIDDPYYGGDDGFERCYQQAVEYSQGLLKHLGC